MPEVQQQLIMDVQDTVECEHVCMTACRVPARQAVLHGISQLHGVLHVVPISAAALLSCAAVLPAV